MRCFTNISLTPTLEKFVQDKECRVGKASSGSHLHKFSSYKCYIFKSSILNLNH